MLFSEIYQEMLEVHAMKFNIIMHLKRTIQLQNNIH